MVDTDPKNSTPPQRSRNASADHFNTGVTVAAVVVIVAMTLHVCVNVFSRSLLNDPIASTLEYTQYWYLPAIVFIGIAVAQRENEHIEARLLFDRLPPAAQLYVQVLINILMLALGLLITFYGAEMALDSRDIGRTGGVTGTVIWPATFVVPLGMGIYCAWMAREIMVDVRKIVFKPTSEIRPDSGVFQ